MKNTILAIVAGVVVFLGAWIIGTAMLPTSLLVPVGALAIVAAFLVANVVDQLDD
jgi:hypothetical protein